MGMKEYMTECKSPAMSRAFALYSVTPEAEKQDGHPRESQDGISPTPVRIFIRHW
jgi:hypothetical protein